MPTPFTSETARNSTDAGGNIVTSKSRYDLISKSIDHGLKALLDLQHHDGYWCFELEADATIPAEYVIMMHYMDEVDVELQNKIGVYLRDHQLPEGGWPLYLGGEGNISCTVKVYYALKLLGDKPEESHMKKARDAIHSWGGAARSNVFTRITLALFEQIPWRGVPCLPVECMLLPRWFPFHLLKISYWSRTVMVPLLILYHYKPKAKNPRKISISELFLTPPYEEKNYFPVRSPLNYVFLLLDSMVRLFGPFIPRAIHNRALKKAEAWMIERLNGTGGLGAIFPAMVNAYEALVSLGYPKDHSYCATARDAVNRLLVVGDEKAYCQPCVSPVWDTGLACLTLLECQGEENINAVNKALDWLTEKQLLEDPGDWQEYRPSLPGGGWGFQFYNSHYPDLDDTAVVAYAMLKNGEDRFRDSAQRAMDWIAGMQSRNGGFASFDADNDHYYLNEIPFADHGALLDPPTSDVSARCLMLLSRSPSKDSNYQKVLQACLTFLKDEQEEDGSWFGRWGTNYIYGTWSVLIALEEAGISGEDPLMRKAANWLKSKQRDDGGWGESNDSYADISSRGQASRSTSFQTAWALLGLMAAGEGNTLETERGIDFLLSTQTPSGLWDDEEFTAPGFPRVFYLKYHGYDKYFPLWALARYKTLLSAGSL